MVTFPQTKRRDNVVVKAKKLEAEANTILEQVDDAYLFQKEEQPRRHYPTFDSKEIALGNLLGFGGFCSVYEIYKIQLKEEEEETGTCSSSSTGSSNDDAAGAAKSIDVDAKVEQAAVSISSSLSSSHIDSKENNPDNGVVVSANDTTVMEAAHVDDDDAHHTHHYHVDEAREFMQHHVRRNGEARYAIKKLRKDLGELERTRGMIDLAIEAKYLTALWHPNIIKMRAMASGDLLDRRFFIVMDRLYGTLRQKLKTWEETFNACKGNFFGLGMKKKELDQLLVERMIVAYDISSALRYMHENKLVYRDIKKENIGFDIRGDVKVFDFGLCKSLTPHLKARDHNGKELYGYRLTPRTGSVPFMAPEVAKSKPYDEKCDVFSFAMLLWEILSMKSVFPWYTRHDYLQHVVVNQERPVIMRKWPPLTKILLKEGWDDDPRKRPDMTQVSAMLHGDLIDLTSDEAVRDRTKHLCERSSHSYHNNIMLEESPEKEGSCHDDRLEISV